MAEVAGGKEVREEDETLGAAADVDMFLVATPVMTLLGEPFVW